MREKVCQAAASMVNGAKAASRRVSPLHPGVMQSVALQLLEPGEAGLDVSHDATKFPQIALHDMWLQPSEERFDLTPVPVHEAGDVGFVNRYTVKLALSVKRGQRIEFERIPNSMTFYPMNPINPSTIINPVTTGSQQ